MTTVPDRAPFGATIAWGMKGAGKTLLCLNSPWRPVHVIDTENSSKEYYDNQKRLIEMGILKGSFTRAECLDLQSVSAEMGRIAGVSGKQGSPGVQYGTLVIDTGGQWSEWIASSEHMSANADKLGQIVWGRIRDRLRRALIVLSGHCNCLLLTAHERSYNGIVSPRCNPALLEVAAISVRLTRAPNAILPTAEFKASRVPFFPPRVPEFTISKMLDFFELPADWNNLSEEDKIKDEPIVVPETHEDE